MHMEFLFLQETELFLICWSGELLQCKHVCQVAIPYFKVGLHLPMQHTDSVETWLSHH
jgi:hypothetical protein